MENIKLEKMDEFFENRSASYEEHMLSISHIRNGYKKIAEMIPKNTKKLLDLGCGTGLELIEIFRKLPNIKVTGIDLTKKMLDKLYEKFPGRDIVLINGNYFSHDFGSNIYDVIISYQTLHHFEHDIKQKLYKKLFNALTIHGQYIECDYIALNQEEENFHFRENRNLRIENGVKEGEFYHYDTPCTVENQIKNMEKAGFKSVKEEWREESAAIIRAKKQE